MPELFMPRQPDYDPVQGKVVMVGKLESERPVLTVELDNKHRIRAVLNNDDIHSDSVPSIGALVECIQEQGLWIYVRTLTILEGHAQVGIAGAGWGVAMNRAHLYSNVNRFVAGNEDHLAVNAPTSQIVMDPNELDILGVAAGVKYGTNMRFHGGRTQMPATTIYHPVVALPSADLMLTSDGPNLNTTSTVAGHSHAMRNHTHVIDHTQEYKMAEHILIEETLVDTPAVAPTLALPVAMMVTDDEGAQERTFTWAAYTDAIWYNIRMRYGTWPDGQGSLDDLRETLLAAMLPPGATSLTIKTPILGPFVDGGRGIGRVMYNALTTTGPDKVVQAEIIEFQVQAQVDDPKRTTQWSEPVYLTYVDYEVPA